MCTYTDADTQQMVQGEVAWSLGLIDSNQRKLVDDMSAEVLELVRTWKRTVDSLCWLLVRPVLPCMLHNRNSGFVNAPHFGVDSAHRSGGIPSKNVACFNA